MSQAQTVLEAKHLGVFSVTPAATLREASRRMVAEDISTMVVVDQDGYLAGVITRTDLLRARLERADEWPRLRVSRYMTQNVVTVSPETRLQDVCRLLVEHRIHRVVVVREDRGKSRPIAVVSDSDLVYHMVKEF